MTNIVERLRDPLLRVCTAAPMALINEAAEEIERLRKNETAEALETCKFVELTTTEISRLRAALRKWDANCGCDCPACQELYPVAWRYRVDSPWERGPRYTFSVARPCIGKPEPLYLGPHTPMEPQESESMIGKFECIHCGKKFLTLEVHGPHEELCEGKLEEQGPGFRGNLK